MPDSEIDVVIRGAGPVGCALALALKDSGLSVRLVGRATASTPKAGGPIPFRPLALSYGSRLILERLGAWDGLPATAIEAIHVSQAGAFGRTRITREDVDLPALGYVADYEDVATHLSRLADDGVHIPDGEEVPRARLLVHAEGEPGDQAKSKDYGHTAIVASIVSDIPAGGTAWERFTSEGPLALLPMKGRYGLVWSRTASAASSLMDMEDSVFLEALQAAFGRRAGKFVSAGPRAASPLMLRYRPSSSVPGEVRIGNAAQALHPVAGQGLNLGLRDAWDLARALESASQAELGSPGLAASFSRTRRMDARATIHATDLMATFYVRRDPVSAALRGAALTALDLFPPARKHFARRMIFGASAW